MTPEIPPLKCDKPQRILLGHLAARGDCLYATAIARQIKVDYPNCFLTWGISSMCRDILRGNPYVDEIWEFPMQNHAEMVAAWQAFEAEAIERYHRGDFDEVFLTQISPNNFHNFDGTVRLSIFRAYPRPITVPITPVMNLFPEEVEEVRRFAKTHHLLDRKNVILFECSSNSGQSFVTPDYALEVAKNLVTRLPDTSVILASNIPVQSGDERIVSSSSLSFRSHAELSKYCSLLVGCSSGISWLCTSNWAKPLPKIQVLSASTSVFASMVHDFEYWGQPTDQIIEMTDCSVEHLADCIYLALTQDIAAARLKYHQEIELDFTFYLSLIRDFLLKTGEYEKVFLSLLNTINRYGWQAQLEDFMCTEVLPKLQDSIRTSLLRDTSSSYLKQQIKHLNDEISMIKRSKLWKIRAQWVKLKKLLLKRLAFPLKS
jgi:ADP-heptose:LPS heptosyltransferase